MRDQTQRFVIKFFETHPKQGKVLEVGSKFVNGSIKPQFEGMEKYVGIDMREGGDSVDIVMNAHDLSTKFEKESFDIVCCFDVFEHDEEFWKTLEQMKAVLKSGGWMLLGFPGRHCPRHEHPGDFYRFMPQAMEFFFKGFNEVYIEKQRDDHNESSEEDLDEIYGWGKK